MKIYLIIAINIIFYSAYTQDQAIEIYKAKDPGKSHIVKLEDKVLIMSRHVKHGYKKMIVAQLTHIDSNKLYFSPVNNNYKDRVYGIRSIKKMGIKTNTRTVFSIYCYTSRVINVFRGGADDLSRDYYNYKPIYLQSGKWKMRVIEMMD